ncbi:MAG TPA: HEAT repeat domain-containing protein [Methanoregulaceae archaeon]|nr:HEAT repeat domain-containing protein [Methanoregulaceae archaeon]
MELFSMAFSRKPDVEELKRKKDYYALIKALRHADLETQWKAAEALGEMGQEALDYLHEGMLSGNKDIRLGVIEALGEIKDPTSTDHLLTMLYDKDNEIRWEAALALGEIGDPIAIGPLVRTLEDTDRYVRYGSALALEKMRWRPSSQEETALLTVGKQEWDRAVDIGAESIPALSRALKDNDPDIRLHAVRTLGRIGDIRAIEPIYLALRDINDEVRWEAIIAAPKCGIDLRYLPRGLSRRPRIRKNPLIGAFLNFILPGIGYFYLGKWWGVVVFQVDVYATLWIFLNQGELLAYNFLLPVYLILALHAWYIAKRMPDL